MTRTLCFSLDVDTRKLQPAQAMESAVLEVLTIPEEYSDFAVRTIAETVFASGAIESRARTGARGGPVRITWAALVEKGILNGLLEEQDA
jgi:hypothetical protein